MNVDVYMYILFSYYFTIDRMSTSFVGFNPGRNCGMRGRISNIPPHLMMNPRMFVEKLKNPPPAYSPVPMEIEKTPSVSKQQMKKEFFEQNNLRLPTHSESIQKTDGSMVIPSRKDIVESNRLKRKQDLFLNEYESEIQNKKRKIEEKEQMKRIAKERIRVEQLEKEYKELQKKIDEKQKANSLPKHPKLPVISKPKA